jgi:hypothetical protein
MLVSVKKIMQSGLVMKKSILFTFLLSISLTMVSQPFVYVNGGFVQVMQGESGWADLDHDGLPDAFITGNNYSGNKQFIYTRAYKNRNNDNFSHFKTNIPDVYLSAVSWGDYDNDGDEDLFITGETRDNKLYASIYRNNRTYFSKINTGIIPVRNGSADWGDYDNDGDLDLLITGETYGDKLVTKIYKNNGNGGFVDIRTSVTPVFYGDAKWIDIDNDKDLDIIVVGESYNRRKIGKIFRNDGSDQFVEIPNEIVSLSQSSLACGDLDNDGDTDFIASGETFGKRMISVAYKNTGKGGFVEEFSAFDGVRAGNIDLGDYDRDGDLDVLITGESYNWAITKIYRNDGKFNFVDIYAGLPGVSLGGAYWGDYDKDGDLDILLTGLDNCYDFNAKLYRNDGVYKVKKVEEETESGSIWITRQMNISKPDYYYFVYASCYCDPFGEGVKDFHAFVSNVHLGKEKYKLMERFNEIVMNNLVNWPKVDPGHRVSIGFLTKGEAEEGRQRVMNDYKDEGFIIHYVNW